MPYLDLPVESEDRSEKPIAEVRDLAVGLPLTHQVIDVSPTGTPDGTLPVVRFYGEEFALRIVLRRWLAAGDGDREAPEIVSIHVDHHVTRLNEMLRHLGTALQEGDGTRFEDGLDQVAEYVQREMGDVTETRPLLLFKVERA